MHQAELEYRFAFLVKMKEMDDKRASLEKMHDSLDDLLKLDEYADYIQFTDDDEDDGDIKFEPLSASEPPVIAEKQDLNKMDDVE